MPDLCHQEKLPEERKEARAGAEEVAAKHFSSLRAKATI